MRLGLPAAAAPTITVTVDGCAAAVLLPAAPEKRRGTALAAFLGYATYARSPKITSRTANMKTAKNKQCNSRYQLVEAVAA